MKRAGLLLRAAAIVAPVLLMGAAPVAAANAADAGQSPPGSARVSALAVPPGAQVAVNAALRDATTRLNLGAEQLRVDRVVSQEWPNASLGCQQPGTNYSQQVTPGYLVVIVGGGKLLEYHTDAGDRAVFCREG